LEHAPTNVTPPAAAADNNARLVDDSANPSPPALAAATPRAEQAFRELFGASATAATMDNSGNGAPASDRQTDDTAAFVSGLAERITNEVHKAVQGQEDAIEAALVALLAGGHALFEGVPGTAKTLLVARLPPRAGPSSSAFSSRPTSCLPTSPAPTCSR
jgi:predicted ATPase with chaperone activity